MKFGIMEMLCRQDLPASSSAISSISEASQTYTRVDLVLHALAAKMYIQA